MQTRASWHGERLTVITLICLTWAYVVLRACLVPFVQDEAASFWLYARTGEFLPFRAYPDAGNHFLNSLFGVIGFKLFGFSVLGVRWGSVLCFPIYAFGCVALVRPLIRPVVRWSAFLALLWCPFLLDYFSMFRGYGPAMAGWVWALHGLLSFARSGAVRHLVLLSVALALALFADLSLLPVWSFFVLLSVLLAVRYWPQQRAQERCWTALVIGSQLVVAVYATIIALHLREGGMLYLGSGQGFFAVTVRTLTRVLLGPDPRWPWVLTTLVLLAILTAFNHLRRHPWRDPLSLLAAVLLADVASRQLMFHLLGTNFPQDRAALHLVPLAILLFAHAVDAWCRTKPGLQWVASLLLVFPWQTVRTANMGRSMYNDEQTIPVRFIGEVRRLQADLGRPVMVAGFGQYPGCWAFHQVAEGHAPVEMRADPVRRDLDDVRMVPGSQVDMLQEGYHEVDRSADSDVRLLFRDRPLDLRPATDTLFADHEGDAEFLTLQVRPADGRPWCVAFSATIAADPGMDVRFVTQVKDGTGAVVHYDSAELRHWPDLAEGARVEVLRCTPTPPGGSCGAYLWNIRRSPFRLSDARLRTFDAGNP